MTPRAFFWAAFAGLAAWSHWGVLAYLAKTPSALGMSAPCGLAFVLLRLAVLAGVFGAARVVGAVVLRPLRLTFSDDAEAAAVEAAAGLGAIHCLLFVLGLLGLWTPSVFWALLLLGSWPAALAWKKMAPRLRLPRLDGWLEAALLVPIALTVLKALLTANAPIADWDSLAVHLEIPRIYASRGAFVPVTWLLHGLDPMAAGLFFVPALSLGDENMAPMLMLLFQALMALALWAAARRLAGERPALAAVALFVASPAVAEASGTPGSDFVVGLFGMLAFWSAWRAREDGKNWLLLSGVMAGLAADAKLSGLLLAAALAPLILWDSVRRRDARGAALWLLGAVLAAAPWYARPWIHAGNPVWPHFASLFGGGPRELWLAERARRSVVAGLPEALGGAWPLLVPLALLGAASWRAARRDAFAAWVLVYAALYAGLWAAVQPQWRYMIPLMPWLCLLAASWAAAGGLARAALLLPGFWPALALGANNEAFAVLALRPSSGASPREAYLGRRVDCWPAMSRANASLPKDAKVLLYREVRGYYLDRDYLVGDPQNEVKIPYERLADVDALHKHLLGLGVTHVLVNTRRQPFSSALPEFLRADALMGRLLSERASVRDESGGVLLYWLRP